MRIFVLLSRIPYPLEKGDKLRAFNQIKVLSQKHEIILCALNTLRHADKQKAFESLQPYCRSVNFIDLPLKGRFFNILKAYFTGLPLQVGFFYNKKAANKIQRLIQEYQPDHLYGQLVRVAPYLVHQPITKTLDYQDAFAHGLKRRLERTRYPLKNILKLEYKRLSRFENKVFDAFDLKTIISEEDREWIEHPEKSKIAVVKNGVDFSFFKPQPEDKKYDVVFTGNMNYPPNVDAACFLVREIMPWVWVKRPKTSVMIAGANPHFKVKQLQDEKVTVTGWIDDIREAYNMSRVFVAPMRLGIGLQNKLLEAMALKVPAVTTPLANAALHASDKKEILIGTNSGELAEKILSVIENPELQQLLTENAFHFVQNNYHWDVITEKLEQMMSKIHEDRIVKEV